jgi:diaminopimelate epimerase
MKIEFQKYQGTGNDFILLDNLEGHYSSLTLSQIQFLCDRKFGIGADGLIKINANANSDFEVEYFNSDGSKSFCGNGARCAVAFAETLGFSISETQFLAIDGLHTARKKGDLIALNMADVKHVQTAEKDFILHTGSPHYVKFVSDLSSKNIYTTGREIRYSEQFLKDGINVNLVEMQSDGSLKIATYERGVENETLSCGTGATACALVSSLMHNQTGSNSIKVAVKGGELQVNFINKENAEFSEIQLIGPAVFVFKGEMNV